MGIEELIGPLPNGWAYSTLGETCAKGGGDVQTGPFGSQLHASDYVPNGIPSIMPQNIGDNRVLIDGIARITPTDAERLSRYRVRPGDIVYSRRGDVERRALIRSLEDGWLCGTGCLRVRFGESDVDPRYASYYLGDERVREWIVRHAHGATMANLNTSILSNLPFVVPPPKQQAAIGDVLGGLDDKIDLNQRMNRTLEAMARATFKDWFVDFGPAHAKTEDRKPYLSADLWDLFPATLDDSGKPEGWKDGVLGDIAENLTRTVDPSDVSPETAYIGLEHMPRRSIALDAWESAGKVTSGKLSFKAGEFLFGKLRPYFHKVGIAPVDGISSTDIVVCRGRSNLTGALALCVISSAEFVRYTDQASTGTKMPRTSWSIMREYKVVLPSSDGLMRAFEDFASPLMTKIVKNVLESRSLAEIRDVLLPKLISGEILLKDVQKKIEEAL